MGVIKVETFDIDVGASGSTHTLSNSVGATSKAFIRRPGPLNKSSGGPTGSTANTNANVTHCGSQLTGTTTITFNKNTSTIVKMVGEVWRYTGVGGGSDEFIVRSHGTVTISAGSVSGQAAISGISNEDKCVPFITGIDCPNASVNDYDASTVGAYMDGAGNVVCKRGATTGTLTVYVSVVEFTGANWTIGHGISSTHDTAEETVTLNTDSTGTGGSTFNVSAWDKAFIEATMQGDTAETGLSDVLASVYPAASTSQVKFKLHQDTAARNDGDGYIHVMNNDGLVVNRTSNINVSEGNGTYNTLGFPASSSITELIDELGLEMFTDTSGTGTAHARGCLVSRITAANGTITQWVHRSGNNVSAYWGVIELAGITNTTYLVVSDVDTDEVISNSQLNVVVTGTLFEATQGTGKVELVENSNYTGTIINQSIDSWSDLSIQFDTTAGVLANTNCFLFVTNGSGTQGKIAITVGTPPESYSEAVLALSPSASRYWKFQNTYNDEVGGAGFGSITSGSPVFVTSPLLCRADTHSHKLEGVQYIGPADISEINTSAQNRRYFGGWIQLDSIQQVLGVIYEEGAQVNNIAMLIGFGNILMAQIADTGDDYAQAYSDIKLTPNRTYHIMFKFEASAYDAEFRLFLDGILQTKTNGNPWTATDLDSHSGNISMGHEGVENLQVGDSNSTDNVDIAFATPNKCYYAHWANWSGAILTPTQIRTQLFEKGVREDVLISADTEANMQIALDAYADTIRGDVPLAIKIEACTGGDFELVSNNITFNERASIQVQYVGGDILTWVNTNGAKLESTKVSTINGGTVTIINTIITTIQGIPQGAEWRLYIDDITAGIIGTVELAGEESKSLVGDILYSDRYTSDTVVSLQVMSSGYEEKLINFTLSNTAQTVLVILEIEINE